MQRHTLLSLAVSAALGGALPAVYAQSQDAQPEARTQGSEQDRFLWDRNEFRDRDFAMNKHHGTRHASDRRDEHRDIHREIGSERREIRQDVREIQEDRADLERLRAERAHNRDQLKVARGIGDEAGVEWERNQIRQNNVDIAKERAELRNDRRELRDDRGDLREALRDHRQFHRGDRHDGDGRKHEGHGHKHGVHHVDFRHDGRGHRDIRHDGDWRDHKHVDWREVRGDIREIREDRARLDALLNERQHNREQLAVAKGIGDRPGVVWERNQIRENNGDIRAVRGALRDDRRELRSDLRDLHRRDHGTRHAEHGHKHVSDHRGGDRHFHQKRDVHAKATVKADAKVGGKQ